LRLPQSAPQTPFEVLPILRRGRWQEIALWWPSASALIVAEAVGTAPAFALGRRAGAHPLLRVSGPPAALTSRRPEVLLVGHGRALQSHGATALDEALAHWRSDIPRLLVKLPSLLFAARGN